MESSSLPYTGEYPKSKNPKSEMFSNPKIFQYQHDVQKKYSLDHLRFLDVQCSTSKYSVNIPKTEKIRNPKYSWSQAFWIEMLNL